MSKRKAKAPPSCGDCDSDDSYYSDDSDYEHIPVSRKQSKKQGKKQGMVTIPSQSGYVDWCSYKEVKRGRGATKLKLVSGIREYDLKLVGECMNCVKPCMDIAEFAPRQSNNNFRNRPDYFNALGAYYTAYEAGDYEEANKQRAIVEKGRNDKCSSCVAKIGYMSPKEKACKEFYETLRKENASEQDGCLYPDCPERGPGAWCVLEGDHIHGSNDPDPKLRKVHSLSDYAWWSGNGGVAAMRQEVAKGIEWKCRFCHFKDPLGNQARKCPDPATMPEGKRSGTPEQTKQYMARYNATIRYPKHQFVDAHKREVRRACLRCARPVLEGEEHCFIFDHRDETTKMKGKDTLAGENGGVAGLVHNCSKSKATLEKIQPLIEREMDLCDLLCANCDHRKTNKYPERADVVAAREASE